MRTYNIFKPEIPVPTVLQDSTLLEIVNSVFYTTIDNLDCVDVSDLWPTILAKVETRRATIIYLRHEKQMTYVAIGKLFRISGSRAAGLHNNGIRKIRRYCRHAIIGWWNLTRDDIPVECNGSFVWSIKYYRKIYDCLVSIGGADERCRNNFIFTFAKIEAFRGAYEFQGHLGPGGRYIRHTNTVECVRSQETPKRLKIIQRLNDTLEKIRDGANAWWDVE